MILEPAVFFPHLIQLNESTIKQVPDHITSHFMYINIVCSKKRKKKKKKSEENVRQKIALKEFKKEIFPQYKFCVYIQTIVAWMLLFMSVIACTMHFN